MPIKEGDRTTGEETGETITLSKTVFVFDELSYIAEASLSVTSA
jgi:hypothetical protein